MFDKKAESEQQAFTAMRILIPLTGHINGDFLNLRRLHRH